MTEEMDRHRAVLVAVQLGKHFEKSYALCHIITPSSISGPVNKFNSIKKIGVLFFQNVIFLFSHIYEGTSRNELISSIIDIARRLFAMYFVHRAEHKNLKNK